MEYKAITDEDFLKVLEFKRGKSKWAPVYNKLEELGGRMFIDELPFNLRMALRHHYEKTHKVITQRVDGGYVVWLEPLKGGPNGV